MRIHHSLKRLIVIAFILCSQHAIAQAETVQAPKLETIQLSETLYVIYGGNGQGSNVGLLLSDNSLLLIDSMVGESSEKLLKEIRAISKLPVQYLINTHDHFDHSGGNAALSSPNTTVIAQTTAAPESRDIEKYNMLTFKNEMHMSFDGNELVLFHHLSHAPSDAIVVLEKENAIFMGDTYTTNWYPTFFSGGLAGQLKIIDSTLKHANEDTVIVPGHGEISDIKALKRYRQNAIEWTEAIMALHKQGHSIDAIAANAKVQKISKRFEGAAPERLRLMVERVVDIETQLAK